MGNLITCIAYSRYCDMAILIICLGMIITIRESVDDKNKTLSIFRISMSILIVAVLSRIGYDWLYAKKFNEISKTVYYILLDISNISFMLQLSISLMYLVDLIELKNKNAARVLNVIGATLGTLLIITEPITMLGTYIDDSYVIYHRNTLGTFGLVYIYYMILIVYIIISNRNRIMTKLYNCLMSVIMISIIITTLSAIAKNTTFLSVTFLLPVIIVLIMIHSNNYDISTGALSYQSLIDNTEILKNKNIAFTLICITYVNLNEELPKEMKTQLFNFYDGYVRRAKLYKISNNRLILAFKDSDNPKCEEAIQYTNDILEMISKSFKLEYKITVIYNSDKITLIPDYIDLIDYTESKADLDSVTKIESNDIDSYIQNNIILNEIQNIQNTKSLESDIIKVYCQPILNTDKQQFRTAEALMRMVIPGLGMIFPDKFIKLAERHGIIHQLSLIILNQTCKEIRRLLDEGYEVDRISVNFSLIEIKEPTFYDDIETIIKNNNIPFDKVAIELTESMNDKDFEIIQSKVSKLKKLGLSIYLDDFGTGYSNMERIMRLPLDTIKFDRSMLLLSNEDDKYKYMVDNLATMFNNLNYTLVFEGVETDNDEKLCINMKARYLQGYKYSKPIPIEELRNFFIKNDIE